MEFAWRLSADLLDCYKNTALLIAHGALVDWFLSCNLRGDRA